MIQGMNSRYVCMIAVEEETIMYYSTFTIPVRDLSVGTN